MQQTGFSLAPAAGMKLFERLQVAERPDEGSRGLQPTVFERSGLRRGAMPEGCVAPRRLFNRRSATTLPATADRGLKPTATVKASRREDRKPLFFKFEFLIFNCSLCCFLFCLSPLTALEWKTAEGYRMAALPALAAGKTGFTLLLPPQTGIAFTNHLSDEKAAGNQILLVGSGVALGDVDGDGFCDIYLCRLEGPNVLYRNLGNWKFEDITASAGVACPNQFSTGCVFADIDGDGDLDLLVNSLGRGTRVFLNDGKGHFTEKADSGLVRRFGATSLALADVNGDGYLDLYVTNYRTDTFHDRPPGFRMETSRQPNGTMTVEPRDRFVTLTTRKGG